MHKQTGRHQCYDTHGRTPVLILYYKMTTKYANGINNTSHKSILYCQCFIVQLHRCTSCMQNDRKHPFETAVNVTWTFTTTRQDNHLLWMTKDQAAHSSISMKSSLNRTIKHQHYLNTLTFYSMTRVYWLKDCLAKILLWWEIHYNQCIKATMWSLHWR